MNALRKACKYKKNCSHFADGSADLHIPLVPKRTTDTEINRFVATFFRFHFEGTLETRQPKIQGEKGFEGFPSINRSFRQKSKKLGSTGVLFYSVLGPQHIRVLFSFCFSWTPS